MSMPASPLPDSSFHAHTSLLPSPRYSSNHPSMAAETVAVVGWVVSPLIKLLVDKSQFYASSNYKCLRDTRAHLKRLADTLIQLQATAVAVERRRPADPKRLAWLHLLKDAAHDADDVLDLFHYQMLHDRNEETGGLHQKVSRLLSASLRSSRRLLGVDEPLNRLKRVLCDLDGIKKSAENLAQVAALDAFDELSAPGRLTSSVLTEDKVFGRDTELEEIVGRLVGSGDLRCPPRNQNVPVVAIVGDGGMGKTTLAQLACDDERVARHFDLTMWVCALSNLDEIELTKQILQSANVEVPDGMTSFDWLQRTLRDTVSSKKFLLVLDDVWNNNAEVWSKVLAPLQSGGFGSRILVTTRMIMVAHSLNASSPISLGGLSNEDHWALFKKCAFGHENDDQFPELQAVGKQIAARLEGSPLAAKVVGGMLKGVRGIAQWKDVRDRELHDDILSNLALSYHRLPEGLQQCFAFCSIFPKNWRFEPKKLVKMWIALGFIELKDEAKRLEDFRREYFDQLQSRSLFQMLKQGHRTYYFMHDLVHDMACSVSKYDCLRIESGQQRNIPNGIRHLAVTSDCLAELRNLSELQSLRTLLVFGNPASSPYHIRDNLLDVLKSIRVLDLSGSDMVSLPENVGELIHLRYLALPDKIERLPESTSKLLHLQTLSVPKKCHLDELPKDMGKLISLRHLDMDIKYTSMIAGIGRLVDFQGSLEFHVKMEKGRTLQELRSMKHLHGQLDIKNLENVANKEEAWNAELRNKPCVKMLKLEWNSSSRNPMPTMDAEVLEGLRPHTDLEELHITRYRGASSPTWMEAAVQGNRPLCNLRSLYLTNCRRWEVLPPLGQLSCLKLLHIKEMCSVRRIGPDFYGTSELAFPSLKDLEIDDMPQLDEWSKIDTNSMFRRLQKLKLSNCPRLMNVPHIPPTVKTMIIDQTGHIAHLKLSPTPSSRSSSFNLEICNTGILLGGLQHTQQLEAVEILNIRSCKQPISTEGFQVLVSLKRLRICQCDITDEQLSACLQDLPTLSSLELMDCSNITSLPISEGLRCSMTPRELRIQDCLSFSSLTSLQHYASLQSLTIDRCPGLTAASFPANFNGHTSLNKLSISNCPKLESFPDNGIPSSLEVLRLIGCHPILTTKLHNQLGTDWEKISGIPKTEIR